MFQAFEAFVRGGFTLGLAAILILFGVQAGSAETVVEKRVAAAQPCSGLKTKAFGVSIGIDKLDRVEVGSAAFNLKGDQVTMDLKGSLACKTSDNAVVRGDASVNINATGAVNLADCEHATVTVDATDFGGQFAPLVQAAWDPSIKPKIEAEARKMLTEACTKFGS